MKSHTKVCSRCSVEKSIADSFGSRIVNGIKYPTAQCNQCRYQVRKSKGGQRSDRSIAQQALSASIRSANYRANPDHRAKHIVRDSVKSDRRKQRGNDLDIEFVQSMITLPCSYCKATDSRMTLDRIDNDYGHLKTNVLPSCIRCNHTRGDMPYAAWLYLVEGMQKAREAGAFDNWLLQPLNKRITE
jgi:hypothetical protein